MRKSSEITARYLRYFGITGKLDSFKILFLLELRNISCFSDEQTNRRFAAQANLLQRFKEAVKDTSKISHGYVIINNSATNNYDDLRVTSNIFGEFPSLGPFPVCYTE